MKNKILFLFIGMLLATLSFAQTPIITAIADGDCTGGTPKMLEIYADGTVDFTLYTLQNQTNANTTWGSNLDLSSFGTVTDAFVYVYYDASEDNFLTEFPSATINIESATMNLNGDDALRIILTATSTVVDGFGVDGIDGTGTTWEWKDGYAKRTNSTGPDAGFTEANWSIFNGDLNGEGTCQSGTTFETIMGGIGTYTNGAPTNDLTSTITAPGTQIPAGTISSVATDSTVVMQFIITDAGGDGLPTNVTGIKFFAGLDNTISFQDNLGGGAVYDKTNSVQIPFAGAPVVNATDVYLPITLSVPEGGSITLEVALYLDPSNSPDGEIVQFQINAASHGFTTDASGSGFEDTFAGGDVVGNDFTIDVEATKLSWVTPPVDVNINEVMVPNPQIGATDMYGNVDIDYAAFNCQMTFNGTGAMSGTYPIAVMNGIADLTDYSFNTAQTGANITAHMETSAFPDTTCANFNINGPQTTTLPYVENFDADLGQTYTYSVSGDTRDWHFDVDKATMNGYDSGDLEEDWLILPGINLDNYSNETMTFTSERQYGSDDADNYIKLYYSTDYSGLGDPSAAIWTELTYTQPSAASNMTPSGDIDLSAITGTSVYFAFKYHYNSGNYRRWSIDNINISYPPVTGGGADCANALAITPGTQHAIHTIEGGDDIYDQWYSFVAPADGTATVENCASDVDIYFLIQQGTCGNDYDMADDDNCGDSGYSENFTFNITAGETYFIGIGNWDQAITPEYDWTLTLSDITPVASIALLRAGTVGNKYELTNEAVITFQQSYRGQKFIQDNTGAILIDDFGGTITTTYNQYDGLTGVTGTLDEYNGMLQFVPINDPGAPTTTANTVTPQVITLAQFNSNFEDYEAELVTINDLTFTDAGGTFATGTLYEVTDASKGTANFRTNFYSADYINGTIPNKANVTGLCIDKGTGGDGITFTARDLADFDVFSSDATLSNLTTDNGTLNPAFASGTYAYTVSLPFGTTATPTVTATVNDANANAVVVDATDITSAIAADRTTVVTVTAQDGTTQDYTVEFNVASSVNSIDANAISIYPNPSNGLFNINLNENFNIEVLDIAGKVLQTKNANSNTTISISDAGVYFLRFSNEKGNIVRRVIVK